MAKKVAERAVTAMRGLLKENAADGEDGVSEPPSGPGPGEGVSGSGGGVEVEGAGALDGVDAGVGDGGEVAGEEAGAGEVGEGVGGAVGGGVAGGWVGGVDVDVGACVGAALGACAKQDVASKLKIRNNCSVEEKPILWLLGIEREKKRSVESGEQWMKREENI